MIKSPTAAYPSPLSHQQLIDIANMQRDRIKITQDSVVSIEDKIQKNLNPEVSQLFNIRAKTLIDLFA
jgi:hypothetical protein